MKDEQDNGFFSRLKNLGVRLIQDRLEKAKHVIYMGIVTRLIPVFSFLVIVVVFIFMLFFLSIVAALYFSELFQSMLLGFGSVTLLYMALFLILILFRKKLLDKYILTIMNIPALDEEIVN
ncbi:MAG: hypothetical protein WC760_11810 [Bacteroidia bacterium]